MAGKLLAEILAGWRQAERTAQAAPPGSEAGATARASAERLRSEYRELAQHLDELEDHQARDLRRLLGGLVDGSGQRTGAR
jgi:hypothetical protein